MCCGSARAGAPTASGRTSVAESMADHRGCRGAHAGANPFAKLSIILQAMTEHVFNERTQSGRSVGRVAVKQVEGSVRDTGAVARSCDRPVVREGVHLHADLALKKVNAASLLQMNYTKRAGCCTVAGC
jgi:hypothetical protein